MSFKYATLDVFTTSRYLGNPLAIVHLPPSASLSQDRKQLIAREFNLSETVFLHEPAAESDFESPITIDIFTTTAEIPFAGHPTVGTAWYLLSQNPNIDTITLRTKAGDIPVHRQSQGVRVHVPTDFKEHGLYHQPALKSSQPLLKPTDYVRGDAAEPVASIVKGMPIFAVQLTSEEALGKLQPYSERLAVPDEHLGEWARGGFAPLYAFVEKEDGTIRTRMLHGPLEDPATGSAASTLGAFLGKRKGPGNWTFEVVQGVEMGRRSDIRVDVEIGEGGEVKSVELAGSAVQVMQGSLEI